MVQTQFNKTITLFFLGFAISSGSLCAQEVETQQVYGDSTLKNIITPQTREIYDQGGEWIFWLTRTNPLRLEGAYATELRAPKFNGHFHRILATAWTVQGKYSVEYYLTEEAPIFVYETFEYFEESAPQGAWRNFKGLAAWERRSYLDGSSIGYAEAIGEVELEQDAVSLIKTTSRLQAMFAGRRP